MNDYLAHYGIHGQKWGIRRFQNPDGSLTSEGREHYKSKYERLESKREKLQRTVAKKHEKTMKAQHKYDRFHPGLAVRLIAGKKWRAKLATMNATRGYKLSKIRDSEYKSTKRLERLEKKMKRDFRDIPMEEITNTDVSWLRN